MSRREGASVAHAGPQPPVGVYRPSHKWEFSRGIRFRLPEY